MAWFGLLGRGRHERAGFALYTIAVGAARDPAYYERLGVPDTLDGRFDMVGLYASLLIRRLRRMPPPGPALAQAVFDAMFSDMDINLRELGVGDLGVSKRVRVMWEAFHGRSNAYDKALDADDPAALASAIAHNVYRDGPAPGAPALSRVVTAQAATLADQPDAALIAGQAVFLAPDAFLTETAA